MGQIRFDGGTDDSGFCLEPADPGAIAMPFQTQESTQAQPDVVATGRGAGRGAGRGRIHHPADCPGSPGVRGAANPAPGVGDLARPVKVRRP